ncbi:DMT family transporter [Rhizobium helianthi]|uniref:DMT family transporter n=1 Tax=Rhizobium helianthi TaxID=1132695 RepID=A0ABW4M8Y7_9HYPH
MKLSVDAWLSGFAGVVIFSGSLPATRAAVVDFSPLFLTSARAVIAASLAAAMLAMFADQRPARADILPLCVVALGVVVGFPLLTALALQTITSARSTVFIGLLPLATALFGVLRGGERPKRLFWIFSCLGSAAVTGFAAQSGGFSGGMGDPLMLAAIIVCGLGYAEGARLSRRLGGWQVICWSLLIASPFMLALALACLPQQWSSIGSGAWVGLAYVSVFSMLIGFVFWYRGLALGGIAAIGQLQLLQPFFGLLLAALLLGEPVSSAMLIVTLAVVACVAAARKFAR